MTTATMIRRIEWCLDLDAVECVPYEVLISYGSCSAGVKRLMGGLMAARRHCVSNGRPQKIQTYHVYPYAGTYLHLLHHWLSIVVKTMMLQFFSRRSNLFDYYESVYWNFLHGDCSERALITTSTNN